MSSSRDLHDSEEHHNGATRGGRRNRFADISERVDIADSECIGGCFRPLLKGDWVTECPKCFAVIHAQCSTFHVRECWRGEELTMQPSQRRDVLASEAVAPVPNIGRKTAAWARKQGLVARGGKWPPATAESFVVIHRFNPTARAQALSDAELLDVLAEIFAKECARGRGCLRALVRGWAAAHFREEA